MKCPKCGAKLWRVVRAAGSYLNEDQFDSTRAGDYYCDQCSGSRGKTGYRYFWDAELLDMGMSIKKTCNTHKLPTWIENADCGKPTDAVMSRALLVLQAMWMAIDIRCPLECRNCPVCVENLRRLIEDEGNCNAI